MERQRAAADAPVRLDRLAPGQPRELLGAGANAVERLVQHPQDGDLRERTRRIEVEEQRSFQRCEGELVGPQRALERMPAEAPDELGATADDPCLRPAEQLVTRERDEVGAVGERIACERLVGQRHEAARPEIVEQRQLVPPRDGGELGGRRPLAEPDRAEVGLVHAEEQRGVGPDGCVVVGGARAVRRADLDEARTGLREHVGDPEPVADLDQLAARDDRLPAGGECRQREEQRGGVVVDDHGVLGAGEAAKDRGEMIVARPAAHRRRDPARGSSSRRFPGSARARQRRVARGRGSCAGSHRWR